MKRGLKNGGAGLSITSSRPEREFARDIARSSRFYNSWIARHDELAAGPAVEDYVQELDDTRINLQAYINDLNANVNSLPNDAPTESPAQIAAGDPGRTRSISATPIANSPSPSSARQAGEEAGAQRRVHEAEGRLHGEGSGIAAHRGKALKEYNELKKDEE